MSLFGFLGNFFSLNSDSQTHTTTGTDVNPTNGLPMINDSIDVNGNPYGTDLNDFYSSFSSQDNFSNFDDLQNLITDTIKEVLNNKLLIPPKFQY